MRGYCDLCVFGSGYAWKLRFMRDWQRLCVEISVYAGLAAVMRGNFGLCIFGSGYAWKFRFMRF
jgi:predicted alpha/beta hydrolase